MDKHVQSFILAWFVQENTIFMLMPGRPTRVFKLCKSNKNAKPAINNLPVRFATGTNGRNKEKKRGKNEKKKIR